MASLPQQLPLSHQITRWLGSLRFSHTANSSNSIPGFPKNFTGKAGLMSYGYSRESQSVAAAVRFPVDKEALFSGWLKLVIPAWSQIPRWGHEDQARCGRVRCRRHWGRVQLSRIKDRLPELQVEFWKSGTVLRVVLYKLKRLHFCKKKYLSYVWTPIKFHGLNAKDYLRKEFWKKIALDEILRRCAK